MFKEEVDKILNEPPTEFKYVLPASWFEDDSMIKEEAEALVRSGRAIKNEYLPEE
jgi:hypothetical protein